MKKALAISGLLLALVLAACSGHHQALARASAAATSSTVQADRQAGKQAADAILPAQYQTSQGLISLAFSKGARDELAQQLKVPKATTAHPAVPGYPDNRQLFEQAVASAAYIAYQQGAFKKQRDPAQEAAHQKFIGVTFPGLVKQYQ